MEQSLNDSVATTPLPPLTQPRPMCNHSGPCMLHGVRSPVLESQQKACRESLTPGGTCNHVCMKHETIISTLPLQAADCCCYAATASTMYSVLRPSDGLIQSLNHTPKHVHPVELLGALHIYRSTPMLKIRTQPQAQSTQLRCAYSTCKHAQSLQNWPMSLTGGGQASNGATPAEVSLAVLLLQQLLLQLA